MQKSLGYVVYLHRCIIFCTISTVGNFASDQSQSVAIQQADHQISLSTLLCIHHKKVETANKILYSSIFNAGSLVWFLPFFDWWLLIPSPKLYFIYCFCYSICSIHQYWAYHKRKLIFNIYCHFYRAKTDFTWIYVSAFVGITVPIFNIFANFLISLSYHKAKNN